MKMTDNKQEKLYLDRQRLGVFGEEQAAVAYRKLGFDILDANYHCRFGEMDLIACRDDLVVFIEVRTRDAKAIISPAETVDNRKQQKLILTAQYYLLQNPELKDFNMRFAVVEVFYSGGYDCTINRIENAFSL